MNIFKIKYSNFIWIIIEGMSLLALIGVKEICSSLDKEGQIRLLAVLGTILLIISLIMIKNVRKSFDCYAILLCLSYIFMFGQHLLFLLDTYPKDMIILTNRVSQQAMYDTGFLVLYSILVMNIGYLACGSKIFDEETRGFSIEDNIALSENRRVTLYKAGVIFFAIAIVPTLITLATNIYLTFTVGYGERMLNTIYRRSGITNIASILSGFMIPALLALFIGRNRNQKWPVIAVAAYMVLYTLSGSRINTMILLLGVLYIQNKFFEKLNFKKIIKYGILFVLVVSIFSVISVARVNIGSGGEVKTVLNESVDSVIENNAFISAISEAGYTFEATATVVDNCPSNVNYNYGISYLSGLIYILPNGLTNNYYNLVKSTDEVFKGYINAYGSGIGSSYIAEAYWNFGYLSLIVMLIFGFLIGKLSVSLNNAIYTRNYIKIFMCIYIFVCIAFYVRSDTRTFYRNFVWFCLPLVILYKSFISNNRLRNRYEKGID